MALNDYVYSIYDDFVINRKVNITILQDEIEASSITTELHHIDANVDIDECVIWFNDALSSPEEATLDAIVAAHTGELPGGGDPGDVGDGDGDGGPSDINFVFGDNGNDYHVQFNSTSYKIGLQMIFRGTNIHGTPTGVQVILKGKGKLKLYDKTNSKIMFRWENFYERDWTICSIPTADFDNSFPTDQAILELWGAKTNSNLYVSCFQLAFSGTINNIPPEQSSGSGCGG